MSGVDSLDPTDIVDRVASCLPSKRPVRLAEPQLGTHEVEAVTACLESGLISSVGPFTDSFETQLREVTGAEAVLATLTGSSALELALEMVGVGPGDEVLLPALTYVATANAASRRGAVPHFVDSEPLTGGIDAGRLRDYLARIVDIERGCPHNRLTGKRIAALVVVHVLGHPADSQAVGAVCDALQIPMVEDAAQALGSTRADRHVGRHGRFGVLSFNGNKLVTTGSGGALLSDDTELAGRARHLATNAKVADGYDLPGMNLRMSSLSAALGLAQIEQLPTFIEARRAIARRYIGAFDQCAVATAVVEPPNARSNYWLSAIDLAPSVVGQRGRLVEAAARRGIELRPHWKLLSELGMYADCPSMTLAGADAIAGRRVFLPSSHGLLLDRD